MTDTPTQRTGEPVEFICIEVDHGLAVHGTDDAICIEAVEYGPAPYEVHHAVVGIGAEEALRLARWLNAFAASRTQTADDLDE